MAKLIGMAGLSPNGKVGGFTFYQMDGKTIMRRLPTSHRNKTNPTPLQLLYRKRFKEVHAFLKPYKEVLNFGFQNQCTKSKKGIHCAYQHLVQKGYNFGDDPSIDPAYLKISSGPLLGPEGVEVSKEINSIWLKWQDQSEKGSSFRPIKLMVFLLNPESGKYYWFRDAGFSDRKELNVQINEFDQDRSWYVYLSFYRATNQEKYLFSDSVFAGII